MQNDGSTQCLSVLCACPNADIAETLTQSLLEQQLAACVSLVPGVTSFYRWHGAIHKDQHTLLIIKTQSHRFSAMQQAIIEQHPDEVPEIIALPITTGAPAYLDWLRNETTRKADTP